MPKIHTAVTDEEFKEWANTYSGGSIPDRIKQFGIQKFIKQCDESHANYEILTSLISRHLVG